ncbi:CpxP family protein [Marinomonas sp. TW1]|uniref:CpxP family protein n=1 Tax=Marinomonas sp. TW1 TaxID=1561203 RepID=UPI0007AFA48F|nr:CpxP family protein [Marinomonas sp. TW1]KZN13647.1 periplasmic repressor CpxP [Marinomonas sp. TW1]
MKFTKQLIIASLVLPLTLGATSSFAHGDRDGKGPRGPQQECRMGGFDRGIMKELALTDSQKEQLKKLRKDSREAMKAEFDKAPKPDMQAREAHMNQLKDLMMADNFNPAKATELVKEMSEKRIERQVHKLSQQHKMLSVLTADQKAKFFELQQERAEDCADKPHKGKRH